MTKFDDDGWGDGIDRSDDDDAAWLRPVVCLLVGITLGVALCMISGCDAGDISSADAGADAGEVGPPVVPDCPRAPGQWLTTNRCQGPAGDGDQPALCVVGVTKRLVGCRVPALGASTAVLCVERCP